MLSWLMGSPLKVKPLLVSKLNTVAQIVFACVVLGTLGFDYQLPTLYAGAHGAGRGFDVAVGRRLCGRMGASHEFHGREIVSRRTAPRLQRASAGWRERGAASGLADLHTARVRLSVWLCRVFGCCAARCHDRRVSRFALRRYLQSSFYTSENSD